MGQITSTCESDVRLALVLLQIWTYAPGHLWLHKIIYLWSSWRALVWFCSLPITIKKTDFKWLRKRLHSSILMFNNLTKLAKKVNATSCFSSVGEQAVWRTLYGMKNFGHYKKLPWDKFVKEKRTFCKIFCNIQILQHC